MRFSQRQVADPLAQANFDQLAGIIDGSIKREAAGRATVSWPAAGSISTELTIAHGLTWAPAGVLVTVQTHLQGQVIAAHGFADRTNIYIQAEWVRGFVPGVSTAPVAWWAFA